MQKVTDNVYVEIRKRGCNTGFVATSEGVVAVDTPMIPAEAKQWDIEMSKYGPILYIINGEAHPDHIAGNCYLGGTLVAHEGTREVILNTKLEEFKQMLQGPEPGGTPLDADFRLRAPDITLSDRLTIYLGKHSFHLMALPGHSPNQVAVYVPEEKVLFTSDNVVTGPPFFFQALFEKWIKTLDEYQKLDVEKIIVGHGEVQNKSYIAQMKTNLQTWFNTVQKAIDSGMTVAEAQEKLTLVEEFPHFSHDQRTAGIIKKNIARIYDYLKTRN